MNDQMESLTHSPTPHSLITALFLPAYTLWLREIVRFYRQKSRVIGAVLPPLIFWFLIGSGLAKSFRHVPDSSSSAFVVEGMSSLQYFFPGTIIMIVLFTAIFSTISIIEDRREGFLQSVLVAPVSPVSIVLGKVLGGATLAFLQGLVFILLAPLIGISFNWISFLFVLAILFWVSFGLTGLGFAIAWQMDSTQGFHSIMNLFLMPMWFLSGALFPLEGSPAWLRLAMVLDPLTYGVSALRYGFYFDNLANLRNFPTPFFCFGAVILFSLLTFSLSVWVCARRTKSI